MPKTVPLRATTKGAGIGGPKASRSTPSIRTGLEEGDEEARRHEWSHTGEQLAHQDSKLLGVARVGLEPLTSPG